MNGKFRAVALDKDGTIFDSEANFRRALVETFAAVGQTLNHEILEAIIGLATVDTFRLLGRHYPQLNMVELEERTFSRYFQLLARGVPFIAGAPELIRKIKALAYPLALVTSDSRPNLEHNFAHCAAPELLACFDAVITVEMVREPKPAAEPYRLAAEQLAVPPAELLVVEDSHIGARAALAAGATVLFYNPAPLAGAINIKTLAEVAQWL